MANYSASERRNKHGGERTHAASRSWQYQLPQQGICGLQNIGNTCFMNSALQCIFNVDKLTSYFQDELWKLDLNQGDRIPVRDTRTLAGAYADLVKAMASGKQICITPDEIKEAVGRFNPRFSGYREQDSHELMVTLLDGLHENLNKATVRSASKKKATGNQTDNEAAGEAWLHYKQLNDSIIVDTFHGLIKSSIQCMGCQKFTVIFERFVYLSLPLADKTSSNPDTAGDGLETETRRELHVGIYMRVENQNKAASGYPFNARSDNPHMYRYVIGRFTEIVLPDRCMYRELYSHVCRELGVPEKQSTNEKLFTLSTLTHSDQKNHWHELAVDDKTIYLEAVAGIGLTWRYETTNQFNHIVRTRTHVEHERSPVVNVSMRRPIQLIDCLDLFTRERKYQKTDGWTCPHCKTAQEARKKFDLWTLPDTLIIHLCRLSSSGRVDRHLDTMVDFPLTSLDLNGHVLGPKCKGDNVYDLTAVSNCRGYHINHYTASCYKSRQRQWWHFNDSMATQISESGVVTNAAYVLIYQKRWSSPSKSSC